MAVQLYLLTLLHIQYPSYAIQGIHLSFTTWGQYLITIVVSSLPHKDTFLGLLVPRQIWDMPRMPCLNYYLVLHKAPKCYSPLFTTGSPVQISTIQHHGFSFQLYHSCSLVKHTYFQVKQFNRLKFNKSCNLLHVTWKSHISCIFHQVMSRYEFHQNMQV